MRFDFITLFPEMFASVLGSSILKRAAEDVALPGARLASTLPDASPSPAGAANVREAVVSYHLHNPRDCADNKHNKVDDTPYGGGPGMVMQCQPIFDCVLAAEAQQPELKPTRIAVTPTGVPLTQKLVEELAKKPRLVVLCGHYEGFDQRVLDELEPMEVSLGDYVLTGGELPAMVLVDSIVRLIPGVIGKAGSHLNDSFSPGSERLLDHPHYTRPPAWRGRAVPDVLLSGDHGKIEKWRREQSVQLTRDRRPDLLAPGGPALPGSLDAARSPASPVVVIRDAAPSDHDAIDALLRGSFETDAEANLVRELREQGDAPIELVAEIVSASGPISDPSQIVGSVVLSPVSVEGGDGRLRAMGLAPLAVDVAWRGRGVGRSLVQQGLRVCEEVRAGAVFVLGEPGFYQPLGFEIASKHGFGNEYGVDEPFMARLLRPLTGPAGQVKYAPAFAALGDA